MDLITSGLAKYKTIVEQLQKNCETLQTEVNLMNKLLFFEQKFNQHLSDLFVGFETNYNFNNNSNNSNEWQEFNEIKENNKRNELSLKKLRQELHDWREANNRLTNSDVQKTDHTYSSAKEKIRTNEKCLPTLTAITKDIAINTKQTIVRPNSRIISSDISKSMPKTQSIATNSMTISETTVGPEVSTSNAKRNESSFSVQMEVIPKTEPLSEGEETDSASETGESAQHSQQTRGTPFLFVSEFLSKNKVFTHLLNKNTDESDDKTKKSNDKSIAIDLNSDSELELDDTGVPPNDDNNNCSIFDNEIIDLTPKEPTLKKTSAKSVIKNKNKNKKRKKKKTIKSKAKQQSNENKSSVNTNSDITVTIVSPKSKKKLKTSRKSMDTTSPIGRTLENRKIRADLNEKLIKNNKNIVLKDKMYFCKWSRCGYKTTQRGSAIRHSWRHTGEQPFKCTLCSDGFRDKRRLQAHVMAHNAGKTAGVDIGLLKRGTGDYVCPECTNRFNTFTHMMRHMGRIHGLEKAQKYRQQYYKQKNILIKSNKSIEKSENSPKTRLSVLNVDTKKISPKMPQKLKIIKKSKQRNRLYVRTDGQQKQNTKPVVMNRRNVIFEELKEWKCDYNRCERSYFDKHNLKRHQLEVHKQLSKVLFERTAKSLAKNIKYFYPKASEIKTKPTEGTEDKNSISDNNNEMQTNSSLPSDKKFVCNYKNCSQSYCTISGLYKHKKTKHKSNASFATIGKKFSAYQSTGAAPDNKAVSVDNNKPSLSRQWICEVAGCGSRYTWEQTLRKHMKAIHNLLPNGDQQNAESETDPNPNETEKYDCSYTECQFKSLSRLSIVAHYRTHFTAEDKPFKCLITGCNYSNKLMSQLRNHVLNRHSEQEFFRAEEATGVHYPGWY